MTAYRLFFLDRNGAIQAREEFAAASDDDALILASVVWEACSETYSGYELWSFARRVVSAPDGIGMIPPPRLDELDVERQERVLALEEMIQRSRWRVAKSEKLLQSVDALRARLNQKGLDRQRRAVTAAEIVAYATHQGGAARFTLQLAEPQGLRLAGSHGFQMPFLDYFAFVQAGDGCACGAALRQHQQTVVPDVAASPFFNADARAMVLEAGSRAVVSTPLVAPREGGLRGVMSFHYRAPLQPGAGELARIDALAREIAAAIADPASAAAQLVREAAAFV